MIPCCQRFWGVAVVMSPALIAFIMSQWYADGCRLDAFRTGMLSDRNIATLYGYHTSEDMLFPTAGVNGGAY